MRALLILPVAALFLSACGAANIGYGSDRLAVVSTPAADGVRVSVADCFAVTMPAPPARDTMVSDTLDGVTMTFATLQASDPDNLPDPVNVSVAYSRLANPGPFWSKDQTREARDGGRKKLAEDKDVIVKRITNVERNGYLGFEAEFEAPPRTALNPSNFVFVGRSVDLLDRNHIVRVVVLRARDRADTGRLAKIFASLELQ